MERQVIAAARPALDAWHRHGLDGNVTFGKGEMPAKSACGILSIEFLVHAWDYAAPSDSDVDAPDSLAEYVLGSAATIIKPELRGSAGFDDPVDVPADAGALDQLVAFTGRDPAGSGRRELHALQVEVVVAAYPVLESERTPLPFMMPITALSSIFLKWSCTGWPS